MTERTPLHAIIEVARRAERAEIEFCALAGATHGPVEVLDAGGGRAIFSRPGSPLNKMLGLGLRGEVTDDDLERIEAFFRSRKAPAQIELCPLAYGNVAAKLCARGFVLEAFENELGITLEGGPAHAARRAEEDRFTPPDVRITQTTPDQDGLWTRTVARGFAAYEPHVGGAPAGPSPTDAQMFELMSQFGHPAIRRYLAWIGDDVAGGGAAWTYEGVVGIFGTATVPRFRRRGVQLAVAARALADAHGSADLAIATTAPGSTSQRTFERLGFRVLYTRAVFVANS